MIFGFVWNWHIEETVELPGQLMLAGHQLRHIYPELRSYLYLSPTSGHDL